MIPSGSLSPLFSTPAISGVFSDAARLAAMLRVEAALAAAQAELGLIPADVAPAIAAISPDDLAPAALAEGLAASGNLAIPLVKELQRLLPPEAAQWVHWGATSQDIIDTGLVLQSRVAVQLLTTDLHRLTSALARQAEIYADTPMAGRTLLQQAVPVSLGGKLMGWLSGIDRAGDRLGEAGKRLATLQFGGAAGTLASLDPHGPAIAAALARQLDLTNPPHPWHTCRDRIVEMGLALAQLIGALAHHAHDFALLAQTEVGEAAEPSGGGRGGSSAMPHKANPVACARILACHARAPHLAATLLAGMAQEHERGLGSWHAEWAVLPELFQLAAAALDSAVLLALEGRFDTARMARNLNLTGGLMMAEAVTAALTPSLGKGAAHRLLEQAAQTARDTGRPLRSVLEGMPEAAGLDFDSLFDPPRHLGASGQFIRDGLSARSRDA